MKTGKSGQQFIATTFIFLSLLAISVFVTWPLALHLGAAVLQRSPDLYGSLQYYWSIGEDIGGCRISLFSNLIFYPVGWEPYAYNSCYVDGVVGGLISLLTSPLVAYNLIVLLLPALNALSAYFFFVNRGIAIGSALAASMWFGFNPYVLHELSGGRPSQAALLFLPLCFQALMTFLKRPCTITAIRFSWWLALSIISYFYYGMFALLVCLILASMSVMKSPNRRLAGAVVKYSMLASLLTILLIAPFSLPNILSQAMSLKTLSQQNPLSAPETTRKLLESHSVDGGLSFAGKPVLPGTSMPLVLTGGILLGCWLPYKRKTKILWLLISSVFFLAAHGPTIYFGRQNLTINPVYALFTMILPLFTRFWWPYRLIAVSQLGFSFMLGLALHFFELRQSRFPILSNGFIRVVWLYLLLTIVKLAPHSPIASLTPAPEAYRWLREQPVSAAIELPLDLSGTYDPLFFQTVHHKPLLLGSDIPFSLRPEAFNDFFSHEPFIQWLQSLHHLDSDHERALTDSELTSILRRGFRYLILNPCHFEGAPSSNNQLSLYYYLRQQLEAHFGSGHEFRHDIIVFDLQQVAR